MSDRVLQLRLIVAAKAGLRSVPPIWLSSGEARAMYLMNRWSGVLARLAD